jgi:hypothetical protein
MTNNFSINASDEALVNIGKQIAYGALTTLAKCFFIGLAVVLVIVALSDWFKIGFDATDDIANGKRSNMALRTDYGTGCQYLESGNGELTPRLDKNGKQFC